MKLFVLVSFACWEKSKSAETCALADDSSFVQRRQQPTPTWRESSALISATSSDVGSTSRYSVDERDTGERVFTWSRDPLDQVDMSGCRLVFLDIGSNVGVHVREVFEATKYPRSKFLYLFDAHLGDPSLRSKSFQETGICAFGFEASPTKVERLDAIQKAHSAKGWRSQFFVPFVASDSDHNVTLYGVGEDPGHNDWGVTATKKNGGSEHIVPAFSLDDWIRRHVLPNRDRIDYVLAKMDIEGSEFLVMKQMALPERGLKPVSLCERQGIDSMTVEYHQQFLPKKCVLCSKKDIVKAVSGMDCGPEAKPATLIDLDDEAYLFDKEPLP